MKLTGVLIILQIVFMTLKFCNILNCSWWIIFIPTYVIVGLDILYVILIVIKTLLEDKYA